MLPSARQVEDLIDDLLRRPGRIECHETGDPPHPLPLVRRVPPRSKDDALECLVLRFDADSGIVRGDPLLALQTREFNLLARGEIDLRKESLDLDIAAQPRRGLGISLGDVINPFTRIGGTLAAPRIVADPKTGILETGAGIATGGLWPLARKLRQRFLGRNPCVRALEAEPDQGARRDSRYSATAS